MADRKHQAQPQIGREHRAAACRQKRQGNTHRGADHQAHGDIDHDLGGEHGKDSGADQTAHAAAAPQSNAEDAPQQQAIHQQHRQCAQKADRFPDEGEDHIIIHIGDIAVIRAENADTEELPRAEGDAAL